MNLDNTNEKKPLPPQGKEPTLTVLSLEEEALIRDIFIDVVDNYCYRLIGFELEETIGEHIGTVLVAWRLSTFFSVRNLRSLAETLDANDIIRDFYLEVTDRLYARITPMGPHTPARLAHTLVTGLKQSRPWFSGGVESMMALEIQTAFQFDEAGVSTYLAQEPWLMTAVLLIQYGQLTQFGSKTLKTAKIEFERSFANQ